MLFGSCNRCGNCCLVGEYRCDNLEGTVGEVTTCKVYADRFNDMPITLTRPDGAHLRGFCKKGKSEEPELRELIKDGKCSYWRFL